jgi:cobalt-zinc-cadmium efflux system membrane fusion protein
VLAGFGSVLLATAIAGAVFFPLDTRGNSLPPPHLDSPPAAGSFRPTKSEWASFGTAPVQSISFRTELVTEGRIALDDNATTPVFSPYSGRVTQLIAQPGDRVAKGAPLMTVASPERVQGQSDLISASVALDTARAQVKLAKAAEKRQHQAYLAEAGALKDWLQSQMDLLTAQNNLRTAEASLRAVRDRLSILGMPEAEIDAVARGNAYRPNSQARIFSPIAGTVVQRQVGLGQYINGVAAGASNPVYVIADLSRVWLIGEVRESDAPLLRIGQPVEVRVLAYPGRVFKAGVAWIAPTVDPDTHRVAVRAEVRNPNGALKPNMFATFTVVADQGPASPAVPESAVVYEGDQAHVWIANADGSVSARTIRTGRTQNGLVEVSEGLKVNDRIITSGALFIDRRADSPGR